MTTLDALAAAVRGMPWRSWIWPGQPVQVTVAARGGRLKHRDSTARKVELAIADALRGPRLPGPRPPREAAEVHVRIVGDDLEVSVEASGERLHKRGWRRDTTAAPLRETLAAACLRLADWAPGEPLVDPMCGSGTFPIEAAGIALGRAPGAERGFAFERWPCHDAARFDELKRDARAAEALDKAAPIVGADRDAEALKAARANARRAKVGDRASWLETDFFSLLPAAPTGLLIANPPYGERLGSKTDIGAFYRALGGRLRAKWPGWRVALLLPSARFLGAVGLPLEVKAAFKNGGIPVVLCVGTVPDGTEGPAERR